MFKLLWNQFCLENLQFAWKFCNHLVAHCQLSCEYNCDGRQKRMEIEEREKNWPASRIDKHLQIVCHKSFTEMLRLCYKRQTWKWSCLGLDSPRIKLGAKCRCFASRYVSENLFPVPWKAALDFEQIYISQIRLDSCNSDNDNIFFFLFLETKFTFYEKI